MSVLTLNFERGTLRCVQLVLDTESVLFMSRPSTMALNELCTPLPCADNVWNASSAEEWAAYTIPTSQPTILEIIKSLGSPSSSSLAHLCSDSAFSTLIVVRALHLSMYAAAQLTYTVVSFLFSVYHSHKLNQIVKPAVESMAKLQLKQSLLELGRGPHEFYVPVRSIHWAGPALSIHVASLQLIVSAETLLDIGGHSRLTASTKARATVNFSFFRCTTLY